MAKLTEDAHLALEALYAIHTRGGGERQTHTDRAIESRAGLGSSRVSAALEELASGGYISESMAPWEGESPLKSFKLNDKGRRELGVDPL